MNYRHIFIGLLFVPIGIGCHSTGINISSADGGVADVTTLSDIIGRDSTMATGPDMPDALVAPDVLEPGPDTNVRGSDAAAILPADALSVADSATEGLFLPPPEASDAQVQTTPDAGRAPSDASGDLATDVPPLPKDVVISTNKDLGPADAQCIAATPGWLDLVSTFLAEDQKCWADTDCTYVSFSDSCGMICVLPMNQQRIGEFGTQVYDYASTNCSTCPSSVSYPACPAPRAVYCNAGRCEYKPG
jgi:hypothetical protein